MYPQICSEFAIPWWEQNDVVDEHTTKVPLNKEDRGSVDADILKKCRELEKTTKKTILELIKVLLVQ